MRTENADRVVALEEKYREKERVATEAMRMAWEQRDEARASLRDLSADTQRLRDEARDARRRLSRATEDTCQLEREQLARSAELLERGARLVERGVDLSAKSALDKDAVVTIVK